MREKTYRKTPTGADKKGASRGQREGAVRREAMEVLMCLVPVRLARMLGRKHPPVQWPLLRPIVLYVWWANWDRRAYWLACRYALALYLLGQVGRLM